MDENNHSGYDGRQPPYDPNEQPQQPPYDPYEQPPQPSYGQRPPNQPANGKAVAALVMGIVGLVLFWVPFLNIAILILNIVGLILAVGANKETPGGLATAGLVLCIIGLVLSAVGALTCTCAAIVGCSGVDGYNSLTSLIQ